MCIIVLFIRFVLVLGRFCGFICVSVFSVCLVVVVVFVLFGVWCECLKVIVD